MEFGYLKWSLKINESSVVSSGGVRGPVPALFSKANRASLTFCFGPISYTKYTTK